MKLLIRGGIVFLLGIVIVGCSILRGEDPEKNVRKFLLDFQSNLTKSDDEVLAAFRVKQSREAILSVVNILQNKDPFIVCESSIANAKITMEKEVVMVEIPTLFRLKELSSPDTASFTLVMLLTPVDDSFTITEVNGEEFYQQFQQIKNRNQWQAERKLAEKERSWIYENARNLEPKFDSVIWYTVYLQEKYFYVVEGNWQNYFINYDTRGQKNTDVLMGLASAQGELIIPMEYDLIGTPGFVRRNIVEVKKNGKYGYFDLEQKQLVVDPVYDVIVPFEGEGAFAVVKKDSTYGWLDGHYKFTPGFASKRMEEWYTNFDYLKQPVKLIPANYTFCEIPSPDHAGSGIIIPPSYFSSNGIFDEIEGGISTTSVPVNGWTEYKEATGSFLERIGNNMLAVVTTIRERYIEGREEFYTRNEVVFLDKNNEKLGSARISGEQVSMHPIDSTLLEVRAPHEYWFMEEGACEESNLYKHTYFSISANREITELQSARLYPQTQFIKLDSSYLTGKFIVYNAETDNGDETTFLSVKTITYMRDEILAAYGYKPENAGENYFSYLRNGSTPTYTRVEDFEAQLTEADRHNLAFLNKVLALLQPPA
jgi:hypothetical protein